MRPKQAVIHIVFGDGKYWSHVFERRVVYTARDGTRYVRDGDGNKHTLDEHDCFETHFYSVRA